MDIEFPYLSEHRTQHGKRVLYVRIRGRRVRLQEKKGTAAFAKAYAAAVEKLSTPAMPVEARGRKPFQPGTLGWLGTKYFASTEFKALDAKSQATRRGVLEACFRAPFTDDDPDPMGNCPLVHFTPPKVKRLLDLKIAEGLRGAANNRKKYLSAMFGWAIGEKPPLWTRSNPVRDVKRARYATSGFHTWSIAEVRQFEERHPIGSKARLALAMLLFLGFRGGDFVTIGRQHVRSGFLRFVPRKTRYKRLRESEKPILPVLADVMAQSPCGDLTFLVTAYGKPFTAKGFQNWFRDRCDEAGLPRCTAHGLRKAGATMLADLGASAHQLKAIYDWETLAQAEVYTEEAERRRLAREALPLLETAYRERSR